MYVYCALVDSKSRVVDEFVDSVDVSRRIISSLPTEDLHYLNLSVAIHFMKDNEVINRLEPRKISDMQSTMPGIVNFATVVPLSGFAPGECTLQVQAIDHTARKFAFQRTSFTVLDR